MFDSLENEPDYVVYSINVLGSYYIGSTNNLKERIYKHKSDYHNEKIRRYNYPLYQFIRTTEEKNGFVFDKKAFDIEALIWGDKETALKVEKEVLLEYKNKGFNMLNCFSPFQTEEEYKEVQKAYFQSEKYKAYNKARKKTEKYKEYIKAYNKAYRQSEKNKEYNKAYHKAYQQTEEYKEYKKAYEQTEEYKEARKAYHKAYYQRKKLERLNNNTD